MTSNAVIEAERSFAPVKVLEIDLQHPVLLYWPVAYARSPRRYGRHPAYRRHERLAQRDR